jgi:hypothetical protein
MRVDRSFKAGQVSRKDETFISRQTLSTGFHDYSSVFCIRPWIGYLEIGASGHGGPGYEINNGASNLLRGTGVSARHLLRRAMPVPALVAPAPRVSRGILRVAAIFARQRRRDATIFVQTRGYYRASRKYVTAFVKSCT